MSRTCESRAQNWSLKKTMVFNSVVVQAECDSAYPTLKVDAVYMGFSMRFYMGFMRFRD